MPNLFSGFPVSRAKVAEIITGEAAPLQHAADHELGGDDEIDVTGLGGAGGVSLPFTDWYISTHFESIDWLNIATSGSGSTSLGTDAFLIQTGSTSGSKAEVFTNRASKLPITTWAKDRTVVIVCNAGAQVSNVGTFWMTTGQKGNTRHVGFKIVDGVLYGTVGNGSSETTVVLDASLGATFNLLFDLRVVFTAGTKAEFYVNGSLVDEITTGLPTGTTTANNPFYTAVFNDAGSNDQWMTLYNMQFKQSA